MILILILNRDDVKSKFRKQNIRSDQRRVGRYQRGNQNPYIEDWHKDKSTNNDLLQTLHRKLRISNFDRIKDVYAFSFADFEFTLDYV
jgi:hypothetical protein